MITRAFCIVVLCGAAALPERTAPVDVETERIARRLTLVEELLRARPTPSLSDEQRKARLAQLDVLRAYIEARRFPRSDGRPGRVPFFVDDGGAACAVAHLLRESGERAFVEEVRARNNNVFLDEVRDDPRLTAWAARHGLDVEELTLIQPTYSPLWDYEGTAEPMVKAFDKQALRKFIERPPNGAERGEAERMIWRIATGTKRYDVVGWLVDEKLAPRNGTWQLLERTSKATDGTRRAILARGLASGALVADADLLESARGWQPALDRETLALVEKHTPPAPQPEPAQEPLEQPAPPTTPPPPTTTTATTAPPKAQCSCRAAASSAGRRSGRRRRASRV